MDAAFIFGTTGNLTAALGSGWSTEDGFAWAIGEESQLTLPLQGDDVAYVIRFDLHPALFLPKVQRQRLMIRAGKTVLGSFDVTERTTVVIPLPLEVTRGAVRLELTLLHPDATRPRDHLAVDDSRRLAICFHSASLTQPALDTRGIASGRLELEPTHGIIAGDRTARRMCQVIGKLPSLKGRFGMRFLDLSKPLEDTEQHLLPETLETAMFCWMELNGGIPATREALRERLPDNCVLRTYYAPVVHSLWPFQGPDARAVVEPGRYEPSRYPYGDRLAQTFAGMNMPDDIIYMMYDMSAEQDPVDLDEIYANDLRRWRAEGRKTDIQLASFIESHLTVDRLFAAYNLPGPLLLREMINQVLEDGLLSDIVDPLRLAAELDTLMEGHAHPEEQIPVHKRVGSHFNLSWWSPDLKYRWMNNLRTNREYILDYIKWTQWRK